MLNPEEEIILEFKAEEKRAQMVIYDTVDIESDCSRVSATEIMDSDDDTSPTPPLFCKLRKARVMIKKLPRHVLEEHSLNRNISFLSAPPVRASKRIEGKQITRQNLSLHVNKPRNELINKRKRCDTGFIKPKRKRINASRRTFSSEGGAVIISSYNGTKKIPLKRPSLCDKIYNSATKCTKEKNTLKKGKPQPIRRNVRDKVEAVEQTKNNKFTTPILNKRILENSNENVVAADNNCLPHKYCVNDAVTSTLPNYRDVLITRYDLPASDNNSSTLKLPSTTNPFVLNEPVNINDHVTPTSFWNNYEENSVRVSRPQHDGNVQVPLPIVTTFSNYTPTPNAKSLSAFPTMITPAQHHQIECHPKVFNNSATNTCESFLHPITTNRQTITVQTFTVPQYASTKNDPVITNTPTVLIINQPSLGSDPLDMSTEDIEKMPEVVEINKENNILPEVEPYAESEINSVHSDAEKETSPNVLKRIIYHTKSVQTKFTCHNSICGLVDRDDFDLNCFYCYDTFPLHKWFEFKEHIKKEHHFEEKENHFKSRDILNASSQSRQKVIAGQKPSAPANKDRNSTMNKINCARKQANPTEPVKKLPLEPRLVAQRLNKTTTMPSKTSSTMKTSTNPSRQFNLSDKSTISTEKPSLNVNSKINEVVQLKSHDNARNLNKSTMNNLQKKPTNNKDNLNNSSVLRSKDDPKLIFPSLPHITIKKVKTFKTSSKEAANSAGDEPHKKEPFIKLPSNINIKKVIKTIPKPTTQQLSSNEPSKPRYFVVKKIIKLPGTEKTPNTNPSKESAAKKIEKPVKGTAEDGLSEDMPSGDYIEDSVPKPTNGQGIVFGITNSMVVIEFLLKLKTYPELWRTQLKGNTSTNNSESIKKLCSHLNNRFDLNVTEFEIRLSIQRVRNWYSTMLKNIHEYNKNLNNTEPYKHKFPLYYRILHNFLTPDVKYMNSETKPYKPPISIAAHFKTPKPVTSPSVITKQNIEKPDDTNAEKIIEFDPDTLYDQESGDDELLKKSDGTKISIKDVNKSAVVVKRTPQNNSVRQFQCDMCFKTYKRVYELKRHKILHFPPEFECGLCSQKFYFKRWAEKCSHLKKKRHRIYEKTTEQAQPVDGLKPKRIWPKKIFRFKMICEICGASYRSIGSLNTHKRDKHLNQREKCSVCNFTALTKWRIVQHQKKRHIVEIGTVEDVAKKSRARTETKTPFSNEARQEFFWRREMRMKLKPGEIFYGCCKCRIVFNSRKEKVLHNKLEHPIKETTVICLICLPNKLLLSNSNCARRHYTDIHKVAWHEIDDLVKRTKPIFSFLNKEEIELLKASENYKALLDELLKDKPLEPIEKVKHLDDETCKAIKNLPSSQNSSTPDIKESNSMDAKATQEEHLYVDCIIDHDYNCEETFNDHNYNNESNYNDEEDNIENYENHNEHDIQNKQHHLYSRSTYDNAIMHLDDDIENTNNKIFGNDSSEQQFLQVVDDFTEGELVEQSIVVEQCIDEDDEEHYQEYITK